MRRLRAECDDSRDWRARLLEQLRVLVGIGRRAAAEQHQRLVAGVPELVIGAGRDHHGLAGTYLELLAPEQHAACARDEEIDLLACAMQVLERLPALFDRSLGERLVSGS